MQCQTKRLSPGVVTSCRGFIAILAVLLALVARSVSAQDLSPFADPLLINAPRPAPYPIDYENSGAFRRSLVQLSDGGLRLPFLDLYLNSESVPLVIERQYRSSLRSEGVFGTGWTSNLDVRLMMSVDGTPRIVEADGRTTGYEAQGSNYFASILGTLPASELKYADGKWVRSWSHGLREVFDRRGRLRERIGANGKLTFSYETESSKHPVGIADHSKKASVTLRYADGLLVEVNDQKRRRVSYRYEGRSLVEVTDAIGRRARFSYGGGKLAKVELPLAEALSFAYGESGNLSAVTGAGGLVTSFDWQFDPEKAAIRLKATSAGVSDITEISAGMVTADRWNTGTDRLALKLVRQAAGGRVFGAYLTNGAVYIDDDNGRWALDPNSTSEIAEGADDTPTDPHAWRIRFTPAMAGRDDDDFTYDALGRPVAIRIDALTRERWEWDDADRVIEWTDADGSISRYQYDALDRAVSVTTDGKPVASAEYDGRGFLAKANYGAGEVRYGYDADGRLVRIEGAGGNIVEIAGYENGRPAAVTINGKPAFRAAYDKDGKLAGIQTEDGDSLRLVLDEAGSLSETVDSEGGRTIYKRDESGKPSSITYPNGTEVSQSGDADLRQVIIRQPNGLKTIAVYGAGNRLIALKVGDLPEYKFAYDKDGRLERAAAKGGPEHFLSYDAAGRLIREWGDELPSLDYDYDGQGRLSGYSKGDERAAFSYDPDGGLSIASTRKGATGFLRYDLQGQLMERTGAAGEKWQFSYDGRRLRQSTNPGGGTLNYEYDKAGRITAMRYEAGGAIATQSYVYDPAGRVVEVRHEDGTFESFEYDAPGQLVGMRERTGQARSFRYAANGRIAAIESPLGIEKWTYDSKGRMIAHEDPTEGKFGFEYAEGGQEITTIDAAGRRSTVAINEAGQIVQVTDAEGSVIRRDYDADGRPSVFTDSLGRQTTWTYDQNGRLLERRTPLGKSTRLAYDDEGRLIETTRPGKQSVKRQYDEAGRLARVESSDGESWSYDYGATGEVTGVESGKGRASYERDHLGRILSYRDMEGAQVGAVYDAAGRLHEITAPGGSKTAYTYNDKGQMAAVSVAAGKIAYHYDEAGRLARIDYPNGVSTEYRYRSGLRIASIETSRKDGAMLFAETYEYDERGNVTVIRRSGTAVDRSDQVSAALKGASQYGYDALNRIVAARFPDGRSEQFSYDKAGNLTARSTTVAGKKQSIAMAYDADQALVKAGNSKFRPSATGGFCGGDAKKGCLARYDAFDRLVAWDGQSYSYDGESRLTDWREGSEGGHFVYLEQQLVAELGRGGKADKIFVQGADSSLWAALRIGSRDYYPVRSSNGSLMALIDEKGEIAKLCSYYAYDQGPAGKSTEDLPCEYAGGRKLGPGVWFGNRIFTSIGARFMTRDSAGPDKDGNLYSYARGNPLGFVDLTGTNSTRAYQQLLEKLGIDPKNPDGLREYLVEQFARDAAAHPDPVMRQELQALATVIKKDPVTGASTVPLKFNPSPFEAGQGGYNKITRSTTINIEKIARKAGGDPEKFVQALKGTIAHESGSHGLGSQDLQIWADPPVIAPKKPPAPLAVVEEWQAAGVRPSYGFTRPYSQLQEVAAFSMESRVDPTLGGFNPGGASQSQQEMLEWIVDNVHGKKEELYGVEIQTIPTPESYKPENIAAKNEATLRAIGEEDFFTHTIKNNPKKPFSDKVDKLKQLRLEQAAETAGRAPINSVKEAGPVKGAVSKALSQEAAATQAAGRERQAITRTIRNAANSAGPKLHKALGAGRSAAKRALAYIAKKLAAAGRFATPAAVVLGVKEAIDTAVALGQAAGQAAFDVYDKYRKGRDAILGPLDKLARDIEALEEKDPRLRKKKKARQAELLTSLAPETQQIGTPGIVQPGTQGEVTPQIEPLQTPANGAQAGEEIKPEEPLGPTTPLGGVDAQPPGSKPAKPPAQNADSSPKSEPGQKEPKAVENEAPDQPPETKQPEGASGESGKKIKDWNAMCGGSEAAFVADLQNATIDLSIVPPCLCLYLVIRTVPGISQEAVVSLPPQAEACKKYAAQLKQDAPKDVAAAPIEPKTEPPEEPEDEPTEPEQTEDQVPQEQQPKETAQPLDEDGLPLPAVPDVLKAPKPAAAEPPPPEPKTATPDYEPERPKGELEKPDLYSKGPKVAASEVTPKDGTQPKGGKSGGEGGGGLTGAYKWAAGWVDYVSGKIK